MNSSKRLITWGWILVAVIPASIVVDLVVGTIANATGLEPGSPVKILINTLVFLAGAVGVIGLPVGIVLLIVGYTRRSQALQGPNPNPPSPTTAATGGSAVSDTSQPESRPPQ